MGVDHGVARTAAYWVRAGDGGGATGIVVAIGWMFSKRRHLENYTRIYGDAGCDSLVCHPEVLNLWFPSHAEALAVQILDELAKEVEGQPRPIVFATFSGGVKACLYKVFQILQGSEAGSPYAALGWSVYGLPALTQGVANILEALFLPEFELQRADYWATLKESSKLGPFLILCSTNDYLAPFDVINKFTMMIRESGCRVDLVVWDTSDHVGHFRNFPKEYYDAVKTFLDQQLLHQTRTDVWSENERILQIENCGTGSTTQSSLYMCRSSRNTQDVTAGDASNADDLSTPNLVSGPTRNLILNSKL